MEKRVIIGLAFLLMVFSISFVSAYKYGCFNIGEELPNGQICPDACCFNICMNNQGYHTDPIHCYGLNTCSCSNTNINDGIPPIITINSPINEDEKKYTSRYIELEVELDEPAYLYYMEKGKERYGWRRLCSGKCLGYSKRKSFKEGNNLWMLKAVDVGDNAAYKNISFLVDTRDPRISRTNPRRGLTNGILSLEFMEENLKSIILNYENETDSKEKIFDVNEINNSCYIYRNKNYCEFNVKEEFEFFEDQEISYLFTVIDVVNNSDEKGVKKIKVDTTPPVIHNPKDMIEKIDGRYVYFKINITEENLEKVFYVDSADSRQREKRLCTRLKDGLCEKRVFFRNGDYTLYINALDKAGNIIAESVEFSVDY